MGLTSIVNLRRWQRRFVSLFYYEGENTDLMDTLTQESHLKIDHIRNRLNYFLFLPCNLRIINRFWRRFIPECPTKFILLSTSTRSGQGCEIFKISMLDFFSQIFFQTITRAWKSPESKCPRWAWRVSMVRSLDQTSNWWIWSTKIEHKFDILKGFWNNLIQQYMIEGIEKSKMIIK